jgi:hypothetical protein
VPHVFAGRRLAADGEGEGAELSQQRLAAQVPVARIFQQPLDGARMARSGTALTCGPQKTIGTGRSRLMARATATTQRCVTLYDVNATTSGRAASTRAAVSSAVGSRKRASHALSVPLPDENGRGS